MLIYLSTRQCPIFQNNEHGQCLVHPLVLTGDVIRTPLHLQLSLGNSVCLTEYLTFISMPILCQVNIVGATLWKKNYYEIIPS